MKKFVLISTDCEGGEPRRPASLRSMTTYADFWVRCTQFGPTPIFAFYPTLVDAQDVTANVAGVAGSPAIDDELFYPIADNPPLPAFSNAGIEIEPEPKLNPTNQPCVSIWAYTDNWVSALCGEYASEVSARGVKGGSEAPFDKIVCGDEVSPVGTTLSLMMTEEVPTAPNGIHGLARNLALQARIYVPVGGSNAILAAVTLQRMIASLLGDELRLGWDPIKTVQTEPRQGKAFVEVDVVVALRGVGERP